MRALYHNSKLQVGILIYYYNRFIGIAAILPIRQGAVAACCICSDCKGTFQPLTAYLLLTQRNRGIPQINFQGFIRSFWKQNSSDSIFKQPGNVDMQLVKKKKIETWEVEAEQGHLNDVNMIK